MIRNTINSYFKEFRIKILENFVKENSKRLGEFELDESYFGTRGFVGKEGKGGRKNSCFDH